MRRHNRLVLTLTAAVLAGLALAAPCRSWAQANDNFANATVIYGLSLSEDVDLSPTTSEPDEPQACYYSSQTVWYTFTAAANTVVTADTGGDYYAALAIYQATGSGFGGLSVLNCSQYGCSITFGIQAGATYYIQAGALYGVGGTRHVGLQEILPPQNDDFDHATPITVLPYYSDFVGVAGATTQAGEPLAVGEYGCVNPANRTVWYSYTPTQTVSVTADVFNATCSGYKSFVVAAYTGTSLDNLTELKSHCAGSRDVMTVRAQAGLTYYFQVNIFDGGDSFFFNLDIAPPPIASMGYYIYDATIFDTVSFYNASYDPAGAGIQGAAWDFGDGTNSAELYPSHQYAKDGDYTVRLTVTTVDGRTASTSIAIHIQTHDVAITKISAPQSASVGQTRAVSVLLSNQRYPENVQVDLYKSVPGGTQFVGTLHQYVPVRLGGRTTSLDFSYTFSPADAKAGKVTFWAFASILGPSYTLRDALPGDNEAVSLPTKVTK